MYAFELTEPLPWRFNRALTVAVRWAYGCGAHWFLRNKVFLLEEVVL